MAALKRRGTWGVMGDKPDGFADFSREVQPGDEERSVSLFEPNEYDRFMQAPGARGSSSSSAMVRSGPEAAAPGSSLVTRSIQAPRNGSACPAGR